jgi:myo-inositol-1-phosphate synthase
MPRPLNHTGLWLIGAAGGVGTTTILGLEAVRRNLAAPIGLISHLPPFADLDLTPLDRWVVGGHEIRENKLEASALDMHRGAGVFSPELIAACRPWLRRCDKETRTGCLAHCGRTIEALSTRTLPRRAESAAATLERLAADMDSFRRRHRLQHLVVVNVASTEPPFRLKRIHQKWDSLSAALARKDQPALPASSLYALAAIEAGATYVNFTPSLGIDVPALRQRAAQRGLAYMGADGKTGETLLKSVLAPMFAARNLRVLSWVGHNIFGNRDAVVLDNPANKAAKLRSKDRLLHKILGSHAQTLVSIEYIRSLDDWKTAWDHIHFEGFLGTKMVLQFIWQGCDSLLAAPLVIDLARFAERAARDGQSGPLTQLACFFKSPIEVPEHAFARQYEALLEWARGLEVSSLPRSGK